MQELFFKQLATQVEGAPRFHMLSVHAKKSFTEIKPRAGDFLLFGSETQGLPKNWYDVYVKQLRMSAGGYKHDNK